MSDIGLRVDLGTIEFNTGSAVAGATWLLTGLDGWDLPPTRRQTATMTNRHGVVQSEQMLESRPITLTGIALTFTEADYWAARQRLLGTLGNLYNDITLTVDEVETVGPGVSTVRRKQCSVRTVGNARIESPDGTTVRFQATVAADDPLKYSTEFAEVELLTGAVLPLTNDGTFFTEPTIETLGAGVLNVQNFTLGRRLETNTTVPVGTVADSRNRTVTRPDGTSAYGALKPTSRWWPLAPGANEIRNDGAPVRVRYQHAWL